MDAKGIRRTDRISAGTKIEVSGTDCNHVGFTEQTQALLITAHGGKILLNRPLVPEQEISVRCLETGKETDARIVGQLGQGPNGFQYGLEFLDPNANIWGINFPPLSESENAALRLVLLCGRCHDRELVYLDELGAEVFERNRDISRPCRNCGEVTLWREPSAQEPAEPVMPARLPAPPPVTIEPPKRQRTANERRHARLSMKMTACIRNPRLGEEVISSENVSRGGLSFKSRRRYDLGEPIEVALPYSPGGANIFVTARIRHVKELPGEGLIQYGVEYIPVHKGWSDCVLKADQTPIGLASVTSSRLVFIDESARAIGSSGWVTAHSETIPSYYGSGFAN